jgi:hypothetical protein
MSRGKHLSLEEARKADQLKQFAKEHPSEGDEKLFDETLERMAKPVKKPKSGGRTSKKG